MRATNTCCLVFAVARITASPAIAFVSPPHHAPGFSSGPRVKTSVRVAADSPPQETDLPLPPRDETFNPFVTLRELVAAPDVVEDAGRYDGVGSLTGGAWRSLIFGFLPATVVTSQQGSKWMMQQEAAGSVYQAWPESFNQIVGDKGLSSYGLQPKLHAVGRKPYSEALSPKAVLELQPYVETVVNKKILELEGFAESGQEIVLLEEMMDVTLESIAGVFFGDYATPDFTEDLKRLLPSMTNGALSIPIKFPWPLNQIPVLGFGKSMDAREAIESNVRGVLQERRADLASSEKGSRGGKTAGVMDSLMELRQKQMGLQGVPNGSFDDDFVVDNVVLSLLAGTDTTAVTLTRVLQLLATADNGEEIVDKLIQELRNDAASDDDGLDDATGTGSGGALSVGILGEFPLLDAVILESFRIHPAIPAVFRKTRVDVSYNGHHIPEGTTINWNTVHGLRAESLYPEPKKFCPFRFLHGDKTNSEGAAASANPGGVPAEQPRPPMFGLGRHSCPGRELAKLEMLMFLKEFLPKFDYELVEGQSFQGVLPANGPKDKLRVVLKPKPAT